MPQRRHLVIVRAGDRSLHPQWLAGPQERSWDLVVSYFGDDPQIYREPDVRRIDDKGTKWPALHDLLISHPELIDGYDYVWLPDDDLSANKADINRLFELCTRHGLEMAQPALAWDSYISHLATLRNANFVLRYTNFVEVMAPCFSAAMLGRVLPSFNATLTGWGLDHIWPRYAEDPARGIAIVDAVVVRHTRPVGGPVYALLKEKGISPWDELRAFYQENGLSAEQQIETYRGIGRRGTEVTATGGSRRFAARLLLGHLPAMRRTPYRGFAARKLWQFAIGNIVHGHRPVAERVLSLQP
jgi:hypothetical protein